MHLEYFSMFLSIVGALTLAYYSVLIFQIFRHMSILLYRSFFKHDYEQCKRYGDWAVITGSTDGIGKQYAMELAKRGINVVLISRNPEKLKNVAKEIETLYNVKTKIIVADFSKGTEVYRHIQQELQDVPVGILVNNVGVAPDHPMKFCEEPQPKKWDLIHVNIMAMTTMTHMLLPEMVQRGCGAIVNVASAASMSNWLPFAAVYGATKAYVRHFTLSIQREYAHSGVHIQILTPFFVSTNMTAFSDILTRGNLFVPNASTYAKHAITTLGKIQDTCGYWSHDLMVKVFREMLPQWCTTKAYYAALWVILKERQKCIKKN